jgi:hypothetical protein
MYHRPRRGPCWLAAITVCSGLLVVACGTQSTPTGPASTAKRNASPVTARSPLVNPTPTPAPTGSARLPTCQTADLDIRLTDTAAAAQEAGGYLTFTNHGSAECQLTGWPHVLGITARDMTAPFRDALGIMLEGLIYKLPAPVVDLRPGQSGYAVVAGDEQGGASSPSPCPNPYTRLRVTPPGDRHSEVISARLPAIPDTDTSSPDAAPLTARHPTR